MASELRAKRIRERLFGRELSPIKIDRFVLLERIGAGGMGEIFAAYDERLDRKVAIKLVRGTQASTRAQDRLLREAQALAQLNHPNVVQIHDAGKYEERVFIAMEFVRGKTLRAWLEDHAARLDGAARVSAVVNMFVAIGRGIEAAHAAGVVHRDFKPENVLIGDDDQRPRVVDFGLARAFRAEDSQESLEQAAAVPNELDEIDTDGATQPAGPPVPRQVPRATTPRLKAALALTSDGRIVGTPRYMSPEQFWGQPVDDRSDQFSFCVALYEALYRQRAFDAVGLQDLGRALANGNVAATPADSGVPAVIHKALARGLQPAPDKRFASMTELLDALEAWQHRRRRQALSGAFAACVIATGTAVYALTGMQSGPCEGVDAPIAALWTDDRRAAVSEAFLATGLPYAETTLHSALARVDGYVARWGDERRDACEDTRVRREHSEQMLDRRMLCLDRGRRELGALVSVFEQADDTVVENAASAAASLHDVSLCGNIELMSRPMKPPASEIAAEVAEIEDRLAEATAYGMTGSYDESLTIAREVIPRAEAIGYAPVQADAYAIAGVALTRHGRRGDEVAEGERLLVSASNLAEGGHHDELIARVWNGLSFSATTRNKPSAVSDERFERARAAIRRLGDPPRHLVDALALRGRHLLLQGHLVEAEKALRAGVGLLDADASPYARGFVREYLVRTLHKLDRLEEARAVCQEAIDELVPELGISHPRVTTLYRRLVGVYISLGKLEQAAELMRAGRDRHVQAFGREDHRVGRIEITLAEIERQRGALDRAEEHARQALAIYGKLYADDDLALALPYIHLGAIAVLDGRVEDGVTAYHRALDIQTKHLPPNARKIGETYANLAEAYLRLGRLEEARAAIDSTEGIFAQYEHVPAMLNAYAVGLRGRILLAEEHLDEAISALERAFALYRGVQESPAERADTLWALARALRARGKDSERARSLAREALKLYETQGASSDEIREVISTWLRK